MEKEVNWHHGQRGLIIQDGLMNYILWNVPYDYTVCSTYYALWTILFNKRLSFSNSKPSKAAAAQVDCLACSTNRKEFTMKSGPYGLLEVT